jgi:hypothetical protein
MNFIILLFFYISYVNSILTNRYINIFKNKNIYNTFHQLIKPNIKEPIILNGNKTPLKKDFCKFISELNDINFKEYRFDRFMLELPHVNYENSILFINDFLIGNGRILNHCEENILLNLNKNTNLIVFQTDNIDSISFKDSKIISRFPIIQFPKITKRELTQYIYDVITFNKYETDLYNLNWINYDIENLDFEKINMLLFELDIMNKNNVSLKEIHNHINSIIDSLDTLDDINLIKYL